MANDINRKLRPYTLYVTKGADTKFTLRRRDPATGEPSDWDAEIFFDLDADTPARVEAAVTGSDAVVRLESTLTDEAVDGVKWRVLMSTPGSPTLETAVLVGVLKRND